MQNNRLLVIDDDILVFAIIKKEAELYGYEVKWVPDLENLKGLFPSFDPSLIILDLKMGELDGIVVIHYLQQVSYKGFLMLMSELDSKLIIAAEKVVKTNKINIMHSIRKPLQISLLRELLIEHSYRAEIISAEQILNGIVENQFLVYYQPQISVSSKKVYALEALLRWRYTSKTMLNPNQFIPYAEKTKTLIPLTFWVLNQVLEDMTRWETQNINPAVSINMPLSILNDPANTDLILLTIKKKKIPFVRLVLEMTETGMISLPNLAIDITSRFRISGMSLAIDDFGTGNASLSNLHKLPFNQLKIDKSFICNLDTDLESQKIVKAVVDLGHNLDMTIVAEGLENRESFAILEKFGCDSAQGFLIAKPMPESDLLPWLKEMREGWV